MSTTRFIELIKDDGSKIAINIQHILLIRPYSSSDETAGTCVYLFTKCLSEKRKDFSENESTVSDMVVVKDSYSSVKSKLDKCIEELDALGYHRTGTFIKTEDDV